MINLDDPVIQEIRDIRHQISAKNEHNPQKIIEYYLELQQEYKRDKLQKK
ncbi:MAG TPA: hypothetical protein V6C58_21485 [Allocoleopsis sp.]